jgi:hypothetical protein
LHAEDRRLDEVFQGSIRLEVPLFQRPYVWKEQDNWEPLWEAFSEAFERRFRGERLFPHFLGAIVLDQTKTPTGDIIVRQVIDGQQRLATLQILIAALRDLAKMLGFDDYREAFNRLVENFVPSAKKPESVFKVWPTNQDRQHFRTVMTAGSLAALAESYRKRQNVKSFGHRMADCYGYFFRQASNLLQDMPSDKTVEALAALYATVRDDLVLVVVDLDENDDPQLIFETLNALGTPLLPSDLVKNLLFRQAAAQKADLETLYVRDWKQFDDEANYWRADVRQGRLSWPRIDIFVAHYLALMKRDIITVPHLFGEFRRSLLDGPQDAVDHLKSLREYSEVFRQFDRYPRSSREGVFFARLTGLDTNMVLPVLLEVLREPDPGGDHIKFIGILESYLVRRAICSLTYKNYNRVFAELLRHLARTEFSSARLEEFLISREGDSAVWPSDGDFRRAILEVPAYQRLKRSRVRLVLEAVEAALYDGKSERIEIIEDLTVEHVMPRNWRENWPLPEGSYQDAGQVRDDLIHTFGNLTLVTEKLNPSMSNGPWDKKRFALQKYSALALNRQLQEFSKWGETSIRERSERIAAIAVRLWPRPA